MLSALRGAAGSWFAKGLFSILLISFAVWGIGPIFTSGRVHNAATAGKVSIPSSIADQALRQQIRTIEQQYGLSLPPELIAQLGLKRQVIQQLVMESLYDQEMSKLGLQMGLPMVQQSIASQPVFKDESGKFSKERFHDILSRIGMNEATYIQTIRGDMLRTILAGAIKAGAYAPESMTKAAYAWENEKRVLETLEVKAADIKDVPAPTADELVKFHTDNAARYMAPEYRALSYVVVRQDKVAADIKISDDDLRAAYDAAPEDYAEPELRNIRQLTTQDETLAKKIAEEAKGKSLEDVAKAHNVILRTAEDISRGAILPQLADPVFALEANKPSDAIKSPMGWHVLEVTKITPAKAHPFNEVKDKVLANLQRQKSEDAMFDISRKLQDTLAGGATLTQAAQSLNLVVTKLDSVSAEGLRADGTKIDDEPALPDILKAAFAVQQGEVTPVSENGTGLYVAQVESITPTQLRELSAVKSEVTAAWKESKQQDMAKARAQKLADDLRASKTVAGLTTSAALSRNGSNRGSVPQAVLDKAFTAKAGDVLASNEANSSWVVRVKQVVPADLEKADLSKTRDALREAMGNDLIEQFGAALRTSYGVKINDAWLKQNDGE